MFIPLFIAILLGFVTPSNTNNCTQGTTVSATNGDPNDPGNPGNPGGPGDTDPGDDTGGDQGHNPPPK